MSNSEIIKKIEWQQFHRLMIFMALVFFTLLVLGYFYYSIIGPIFFSVFLTYLLLPLVRLIRRIRVGASIAALSIIAVFLGLVVLASAYLLPTVYKQALILLQLLPTASESLFIDLFKFFKSSVLDLGFISEESFNAALKDFSLTKQVAEKAQQGLIQLWQTASGLPGKVVNLALVPIITFFMLRDYQSMVDGFSVVVPADLRPLMKRAVDKVDHTLKAVIKGQLTVAVILGLYYVIGLTLIGLPAALAIGVIAGVCRIIPYLDLIVGAVLSIVVLATHVWDWGQAIGVLALFLSAQAIDGMFITPRFIGQRVGLHPGIVIASVIAFGHLMGFWGILLAIPIVAIAKVFWNSVLPYYKASSFFQPKEDSSNEKSDSCCSCDSCHDQIENT